MKNILYSFSLSVLKKMGHVTRFVFTMVMICLILTFAPGKSNATDVVDAFSKQSNSKERVMILKNLADTQQPVSKERSKTLISMGLSDEKPNVVEAAVSQIGRLKLVEFEDQLIQTYNNAKKAHKGYAERVRLSCLVSLGKIGGPKTALFLSKALSKDQGTVQGGVLLQAVRELKDPSLTEDLEAYADKMAAQIEKGKSANHNPMLYSMALQHLAYAEETINILSRLKGGQK
jgi:hypothetical protein